MIPVVVSTFTGREAWLEQCVASMPEEWTVHVVHGWELDAIDHASRIPCERFLFVQDSFEVLDPVRLEADIETTVIDNRESGGRILTDPSLMQVGQHGYAGVFIPRRVRELGVPQIENKSHAIHMETVWCNAYGHSHVMYPEIADAHGRMEERHGRRNLVLDNGVIRKWKGTWR